jgi:hypothetical protein
MNKFFIFFAFIAKEYFGIDDYTYQPKLNFGQTSNGIGLTLSF